AWNMRQKGAWNAKKSRSFKNGPFVTPGTYTAKLTVGNLLLEQPFEIRIDPRAAEEGITMNTLSEQLVFENKIIDLLTEANRLQATIEAAAKETKDKSKKEDYERLLKQLKNEEGAYPKPVLIAQISYLNYIVGDSDKEIGNDAQERYEELAAELKKLKTESGL
ncbi:MAG: hypothetical protein WA810_05385, partial [Maribacter sp.]